MAAIASYSAIPPSSNSSNASVISTSSSNASTPSPATRTSVASACCCPQCLAARAPRDWDDCPECVRWRVSSVSPGSSSAPPLPASTRMSLRGGFMPPPLQPPPPPRPPPAIMPVPPVTVAAAAALQPLLLQPSPPPSLVDESVSARIVVADGGSSSPLSPLLLEDEVECQQREPFRLPHLEVAFTSRGVEEHPIQRHHHAATSSQSTSSGNCVELQSMASEALKTQPLSSLGTLDDEAEMLDVQPAIPRSSSRRGSGGSTGTGGETPMWRDPISQLRILGMPSPVQTEHEGAASSAAARGAIAAPMLAQPLQQQQYSSVHFSHPPLGASPLAAAPASGAAPVVSKRFSSSSFLQDSVESPPPDFQQDSLNDLLHAQDRPPNDPEQRDEIRAAAAAIAEEATVVAEPPLDESCVTAIGDVSLVPSLSSEQLHSHESYNSLFLHEEFADVRIGAHQPMQDELGVGPGRRRDASKRSPANNRARAGTINQSASVLSPHNTRRKKQSTLAVKTDLSMPSTPEQAPKRTLQNRRNSDVVPPSSARMQSGSDFSSVSSAATAAAVAATVPAAAAAAAVPIGASGGVASAPSSNGSSRRGSLLHKRKVSDDNDRLKVVEGGECASCAHCAECAKHWRDLDQGSLIKHDADHGHVHSRASAPSSPRTAAAAAGVLSSASHPSKLSLPSHAPPLHPPSPHHAARNHFGSALKANHAVRTADSMTDSPQHVSLALSPSLRSRRLHHTMRRGHVYEVDCVLDVRVRNDLVEFLVAWKGYPDMFQSWEPAHSLHQACSRLIADFEESRQMDEADDEDDGSDASARLNESPSFRAPDSATLSDGGDTDEDMREAMAGPGAASPAAAAATAGSRFGGANMQPAGANTVAMLNHT